MPDLCLAPAELGRVLFYDRLLVPGDVRIGVPMLMLGTEGMTELMHNDVLEQFMTKWNVQTH
ncbi:hypothetical protein D3C80_2241460 [compost metagenome]